MGYSSAEEYRYGSGRNAWVRIAAVTGHARARDYPVEPEQIDLLIECTVAYDKRSWEKETASEEDEDFLVVISTLSDLWQAGAMSGKQRLFFEETFGLSGCRGESVCGGGCDGG